ncbi:hypothetical protein [Streptomyces qinglanensis]|uniref:hypothetical protein n=1 Tax=Streptomyces qinglanensis TaxID=943816 RepID=UPI003D742F42
MGRAGGLERMPARPLARVRLALLRPALLGLARMSLPRVRLPRVSLARVCRTLLGLARVRLLPLVRPAPGGVRLVLR